MADTQEFGIGLIGLGIGQQHLLGYQRRDLHVAAICDKDVTRLNEVGNAFGINKRYTRIADLIKELEMDYTDIITIEPGKRGGKPCIRGMRITVYEVLEYLASGMTTAEILDDFPYLTETDIRACLAYAADREKAQIKVPSLIQTKN